MFEHRFVGVEFSDLPSLVSGKKSDLTPDNMADLILQDISLDDENAPAPDRTPD